MALDEFNTWVGVVGVLGLAITIVVNRLQLLRAITICPDCSWIKKRQRNTMVRARLPWGLIVWPLRHLG